LIQLVVYLGDTFIFMIWSLVPPCCRNSIYKCGYLLLDESSQSNEVGLFRSIREVYPLALTLYVMDVKALGYLLHHKVLQRIVRGIFILKSNVG